MLIAKRKEWSSNNHGAFGIMDELHVTEGSNSVVLWAKPDFETGSAHWKNDKHISGGIGGAILKAAEKCFKQNR